MLRRLNVPTQIAKPIPHKLIARCNNQVAARLQDFDGTLDILWLIFNVGDYLSGDHNIEVIQRERSIKDICGHIVYVGPTSLRCGDTFRGKVDPVRFSEVCQSFSKPAASASKIQYLVLFEGEPANQAKNFLCTPLRPGVKDLAIFPI